MRGILLTMVAGLAVAAGVAQAAEGVTVYSSRNEHLIKPLFEQFTKETGVPVRYITDKEGPLMARLKAEGRNTPADILMTVDAGNLWQATQTGLLQPLESPVLEKNIPEHLQDPANHWFGLSVRARTIVYNPGKVKPEQMSTYEQLADPQWKGQLCLRTSKKVYNQSLVATLIARHGEAKTEQIVRGWVNNLATPPFANDDAVIEAVAAGQCSVGIVNTYYFGRQQKKNPELNAKLFWPNQQTSGVHVNVAGAGITKYAPQPKLAQQLIEWLSSDKAQEMFAGINLEYPANPNVAVDPLVEQWGKFKADSLNVSEAGRLQTKAVMLMDRAGYR